MGIARNMKVLVEYINKDTKEKTDVSNFINPSLSSLTYTDNSRNAIDDLSIELENFDKRWLSEWYPDENTKFKVSLIQTDDELKDNAVRSLNIGSFYADQMDFSPDKLSLKLIAIPLSSNIRDQKNSKSWEKVTLEELVSKIANKHEMGFEKHVKGNIFFDRIDQVSETDLSFIQRICKELSISVKVTDDKIIVFEDSEFFENEAITLFEISDYRMKDFSISEKNQGVYDKVEISYYDPVAKKHIVETITKEELEKRSNPDTEKESTKSTKTSKSTKSTKKTTEKADSKKKTLKVNTKGKTDPKKTAEKTLKEKEKERTQCSLNVDGDVDYCAGMIIKLGATWGRFSGKYSIDKVEHSLSSDYSCSLEVYKVGELDAK